MYEIVWQYDELAPSKDEKPADADSALQLLIEGNRIFTRFFDPHRRPGEVTRHVIKVSSQDVGLGGKPGEAPKQEPFAAFLSCADARVPVELIFEQQANALFVVRVAGNVLGDECLGSLDYAVDQLGTVRLLAVLGHTGCGAVTAAVDAYLTPAGYLGVVTNFPLHTIIGGLMSSVRGADFALAAVFGETVRQFPGYRQALIETTVMINTGLSAAILAHNFHDVISERLKIVFGVYDLRYRSVGLPNLGPDGGDWNVGMFAPPSDQAGFENFDRGIAGSRFMRDILNTHYSTDAN